MGSEAIPTKKSDSNGGDLKDGKKSSVTKGKGAETIASVVAENAVPQTQQNFAEKAKDLKVEVPVVSAAGPSLNDDAHHINVSLFIFKFSHLFQQSSSASSSE